MKIRKLQPSICLLFIIIVLFSFKIQFSLNEKQTKINNLSGDELLVPIYFESSSVLTNWYNKKSGTQSIVASFDIFALQLTTNTNPTPNRELYRNKYRDSNLKPNKVIYIYNRVLRI